MPRIPELACDVVSSRQGWNGDRQSWSPTLLVDLPYTHSWMPPASIPVQTNNSVEKAAVVMELTMMNSGHISYRIRKGERRCGFYENLA